MAGPAPPSQASWMVERPKAPTRDRLLFLVQEHPGISFREAGRRLGCGVQNVRYHARMLQKEGLVNIQRRRRSLHLEPITLAVRLAPEQRELVTNPLNHAILRSIAMWPDITRTDIAHEVGISVSRVRARVEVLAQAGVATWQRSGRCVRHRITQAGKDALRAVP